MKRCPRVGSRVKFAPNPGAMMFYTPGTHPPRGDVGVVTTIALPGGKGNCLPGPRGGMVYVHWAHYGVTGVFRDDVKSARQRRR